MGGGGRMNFLHLNQINQILFQYLRDKKKKKKFTHFTSPGSAPELEYTCFRKRSCKQPVLKERWQPTTVYPAYNNNWECKNTIKLLFFAQRRDDGDNCIYYTLNSIKQLLDSVFIP